MSPPSAKAIADKTLTTLLGASVAINGFFATRQFTMLDEHDKRISSVETATAVTSRVDQYQDERISKDSERISLIENWCKKQQKG